jgi:hypothetical protein
MPVPTSASFFNNTEISIIYRNLPDKGLKYKFLAYSDIIA